MNHTARGNAAFTRDASGFRFNAHARWHYPLAQFHGSGARGRMARFLVDRAAPSPTFVLVCNTLQRPTDRATGADLAVLYRFRYVEK
jgi:hypothetical protein